MNLESSQGITEGEVKPVSAQVAALQRNTQKARRRAKAWRKKNRAKMLKILADARAKYSAQRAKKRARVPGVPATRKVATTQSAGTSTLTVSNETKRLFDAFKNGAASVDFALRTLLDTVKGKKLVAKPVAVEYSVE